MRESNAMSFGSRRRRPRARRGVALLMVTVALGVAGAATTFYLASRDNSSAIGENATLAASAQWASQSGAELAVAVMQTSADWKAGLTGGKLIDRAALNGATVSVLVTDINGKPPTASTRDVIVTAIATARGMTVSTQRLVSLQPEADVADAVDPELGEFGVYATTSMQVEDNGTLGVWDRSPDAAFGSPGKVGIGSVNSSDLSVGAAARVKASKLYVRGDASAGLKSMVSGSRFTGGAALVVPIPAVPAKTPSSVALAPIQKILDYTMDGYLASGVIPNGRYQSYKLDNGAVGLLAGVSGPYSFRDLNVSNTSALLIQGDVIVEVRGNLTVDKLATIEMADPTATVTFFVSGNVTIDDSAVGFHHDIGRNPARSCADASAYRRPSMLRLWGVGSGAKTVRLDNNALANMSVHMPYADVEVRGSGTTLIGRVTAKTLRLRASCAILMDPCLDNRVGFTTPTGPLYKSDGSPVDGLVTAITTFDPTQGCQALSSTIDSAVDALAGSILDPLLGGGKTPTITPRAAARATARPWPMRALAMENNAALTGSRTFSGSLASPDIGGTVTYDQDQQELDSKTTGGNPATLVVAPG